MTDTALNGLTGPIVLDEIVPARAPWDHVVRKGQTLRIVDRAYLLEKGKVHFEGTGEALIKDDQARKFYLGEDFNM